MTLFLRVLGKIGSSIASGCVYFCAYFLILIVSNGNTGHMELQTQTFVQGLVASVIMGLGFNMPTLVYYSTKLPLWKKLLVHLGFGMGVFFACIYAMGWYPQNGSFLSILLFIFIGFAIFFVVWFGFYSYFYIIQKADAKLINEGLKQLDKQDTQV